MKNQRQQRSMIPTLLLLVVVMMMWMLCDNNNVSAFTHIQQHILTHSFVSYKPIKLSRLPLLSLSSSSSLPMHDNSRHPHHSIRPYNNNDNNKKNNILHRTINSVATNCQVALSFRKKLALLRSVSSLLLLIRPKFQKRIRHYIITFITSAMLIWNIGCFGSSSSSSCMVHAASATASSTTSTSSTVFTERILDRKSNSDVDRIIDQYVQKHMFDDDLSTSDPIAGTYREAYYDHMLPQQYPFTLRNIITEAFRGSKLSDSSSSLLSSSNVAKPPPLDVGLLLTRTVQLLQRTLGLTELTATIVLAITFVVAGPSIFLLFGMIVGGISKRNMDQIFKKRYGETYTVDATIKQEPVVELPSDDDDDDDEGDDSDDNDDDDEDDNDDGETKGKNKNKKK